MLIEYGKPSIDCVFHHLFDLKEWEVKRNISLIDFIGNVCVQLIFDSNQGVIRIEGGLDAAVKKVLDRMRRVVLDVSPAYVRGDAALEHNRFLDDLANQLFILNKLNAMADAFDAQSHTQFHVLN